MLIFLCVLAGSCVRAQSPKLPYSNQQKSNLTAGMVKKYVKVGEATQTDLITVFGAPNIITCDKGYEVIGWTRWEQITSHIEPWGKEQSMIVEKPAIYQYLFQQIQRAIFIRQGLKDYK